MKTANVVYKKVEIENWSSTGKNVTHRQIAFLVNGADSDGKILEDAELMNYTHSLAGAKKVIDALLACGTQVLNGRLVITCDQLFCLTPACEFANSLSQETVNAMVAKVMEVK
jgi:hypothetical protein